ncbi:cytochrome C oxidase subunit IV family protein [Denitromonas ohlonensis]|nr:cytochrome C oxidase subunit IV family protein [Denitromonas ohlonensis]
MSALSNRNAVLVWAFLVAATLGSGWLAEHQGTVGHWTALFVMLVAYAKGRAVMMYFMEMHEAPFAWRLAFEIWGAVATAAIVGLWWFAGGA